MKKLLALLLILMLCVSVMTACGEVDPVQAIADADKALESTPYKMVVSMQYSSDNEEIAEEFGEMNMSIPAVINGNDLSMEMSMDETVMSIQLVDGTYYMSMSAGEQSQKLKAVLTDEQMKEVFEERTDVLPFDQFTTKTAEKVDGKVVISFTDLSKTGYDELTDLTYMPEDAEIKNIVLKVTLDDDKYEEQVLSFDFSVTEEIDGKSETIVVTVSIKITFSYENITPPAAPADADTYTELSYDELF